MLGFCRERVGQGSEVVLLACSWKFAIADLVFVASFAGFQIAL